MTNEEILEEIYSSVHQHDVLDEFSNEVNHLMKFGEKKTIYEIVSDVYYSFIKKGIIKE